MMDTNLMMAAVLAHAGHGDGSFGWGVLHPVTGWDHLLAMVAVGLWAGAIGGRAVWAVPAAFVSAMVGGAVLALAGVAVPGVEQGIAASVFALGLLVALGKGLPAALAVAWVAIFAVFHGAAHGAEMPAGASAAAYIVGFALTTALLHAAGVGAATLATRTATPAAARLAGVAIAAVGAGMWLF